MARLRDGFTAVPAMREVGTGSLAADAGTVLGRELRAVNIDVNFAPVANVDSNPQNPVIADRSFGRDPAAVGRLAATLLLTAMQDARASPRAPSTSPATAIRPPTRTRACRRCRTTWNGWNKSNCHRSPTASPRAWQA